ncbi:hypothetical protein F183_A44230 [Bryobacterales bacterium F-183]|nr:hypothetical protein F183_A44230 [Bryobacterales bacterium F-183]
MLTPTLTSTGNWFPILDAQQAHRDLVNAITFSNRFDFCGETHTLAPGFDWLHNPSTDEEWLILLHKFYYAAGLGRAWHDTGDIAYRDKWVELTEAWIAGTPIGFLSSDVAGRRIQNWISAWYFFAGAELPDGFRDRFFTSLTAQADWLIDNLSPARNHRTLELLALFLAGVALSQERWLTFAKHAIVENICADFHPDGVHIEQSTDYHHIVLRNALAVRRLAAMNEIALPAEFDVVIRRALDFALFVHRPDGQIPSLSDGDSGSFLDLLEQGFALYGDPRYRWVATGGTAGIAPTERLKAFPNGGYYILRSVWRDQNDSYLVFDCGPLGAGNHGHFDLLSFELYGFGRPLIVDPGRYTYDESGSTNWRAAFRGTAFHNTVLVDGRNQTRYEFHKRKFKVRGPAPEFQLLGFGTRDGYDFVSGQAASYEYDVLHQREIRMMDGGRSFVILDELRSPTHHHYEQRFHLVDPQAVRQGSSSVRALGLQLHQHNPGVDCRVDAGCISQTYGSKQPAAVAVFSQSGTNVQFETHLELMP